MAFTHAPRVILHCPECGNALLRIRIIQRTIYLDARGKVYLRLERRWDFLG